MTTKKMPRDVGNIGAAGTGERPGGAFSGYPTTPPPTIATGNLRACLTARIARVEARHEIESDPARRCKLARLIRALAHRLADCVLREVGRE